jgi:hypothetical protein
MGAHLIEGTFQSDKYPECPRGKVPLSVKDVTAQDLLYAYAQRRRVVDAEFSDDLETALANAGYQPSALGGVVIVETEHELHVIPRTEVRHVEVGRNDCAIMSVTYTLAQASPRCIEFHGDCRPKLKLDLTAEQYNEISARAMIGFITRGNHDMRLVRLKSGLFEVTSMVDSRR